MDWKSLKVGDTVTFFWDEFDGSGRVTGQVASIEPDHAIIEADGMHLWIDENTEDMFEN